VSLDKRYWPGLDLAVAYFHSGCRSSVGSYAGTVSTTGAADNKPFLPLLDQALHHAGTKNPSGHDHAASGPVYIYICCESCVAG
jgi:hypothetical protein